MKIISVFGAALVAAGALSCTEPTPVPPGAADATPASVKIGSANLAPDLDVTTPASLSVWRDGRAPRGVEGFDPSRAPAPWTGGALAPGAGDFLVSARAEDAESGIKDVSIKGALEVWCHADRFAVSGRTPVSIPNLVDVRVQPSAAADGSLPSSAVATATVALNDIQSRCPANLRVVDWQADFTISSTNGAGLASPAANVAAFSGPASLRVVAHNMYAPCLAAIESQAEYQARNVCLQLNPQLTIFDPTPGDPIKVPMDVIWTRWGDYFRQQDVVFLSEAETRWVDGLLAHMPGFQKHHAGDVAILSRWPLSDLRSDSLTTPFNAADYRYQGNAGSFNVTSSHVRATIAAPGGPIVAYAVHLAHRPAPPESSPNRLAFAGRIDADIAALDPRTTVLVGGDFNSRSHFIGPTDLDAAGQSCGQDPLLSVNTQLYAGASMPEISVIERRLRDARAEAAADGRSYAHNCGWPIDYVFHRGAYAGSAYTSVLGAIGAPSDHDMIRVELARIRAAAP